MARFKLLTLIVLLAAVSCSNNAPEVRVQQILTDRGESLAVAEGCTGGTIAARFTALPGASAFFRCGIVAYSNESKRKLLGIRTDTIAYYGVVSEPVACLMSKKASRRGGASYAIATTGIAGPTGDTPEYPIGSVWISITTPEYTTSRVIARRLLTKQAPRPLLGWRRF